MKAAPHAQTVLGPPPAAHSFDAITGSDVHAFTAASRSDVQSYLQGPAPIRQAPPPPQEPLRYPLAVPEPVAPPRLRGDSGQRAVAEPPRRRSKRPLFLAGAALLGIGAVAAIAFALRGAPPTGEVAAPAVAQATPSPAPSAGKPAPAAIADATTGKPASAPTANATGKPASAPTGKPAAVATDAGKSAPAERQTPRATPTKRVAVTSPARPTRRPARRPSKKVVVEYADKAETIAPSIVAQDTEDPAITRARAAYLSGNQKLFAGDTSGAIRAYRESLELYPGYVGGYRGLGLAYAQSGDTGLALEAFKTYVATVPTAKDIALIKKRIARLQRATGRPTL